MKRTLSRPDTMLYDGDCGICSRAALWVARRAPGTRFRVLPLQAVDVAAEPELAHRLAGCDLSATLHVITADGRVVTGAAAVLAAARAVPRWGTAARVADNRVGHTLLEPLYRKVAANRHRIGRALGMGGACAVSPDRAPLR